MTQEQIEQANVAYGEELDRQYTRYEAMGVQPTKADILAEAYHAFAAGANSRQAKIDKLAADTERYKQDIAEGLKREDVARKVIDGKRAEVDALTFRWRKVPRDKDGFIEWDALELPQEGTYLRAMCNGDYEVSYELCTESDMKYVKAVLPFPEYEP